MLTERLQNLGNELLRQPPMQLLRHREPPSSLGILRPASLMSTFGGSILPCHRPVLIVPDVQF
jgi:hypothetical protein